MINAATRSKNAVCAFQIICKLLFFYLGRFLRNWQTINAAIQSKNTVSAFQITYKLLSFTLKDAYEISR